VCHDPGRRSRRARGLFPPDGPALRAEPGDTLVMGAAGGARFPQVGRILDALGERGSPPYRVRWLAGEYESQVTPGPGARVDKGR
jgi:hypothetical protein